MKGKETRSSSSCAACKFLKRRCTPNCAFAPYFLSDEPKKFAKVHKVFGASNVSKILTEVPQEQREDAVNSLVFEAEARLKDPVYGCIGAIAMLQKRMVELQHDLAIAKARLARYATANSPCCPGILGDHYQHHHHHHHHLNMASSFSDLNLLVCNGMMETLNQSFLELDQSGWVNDFIQVPFPQ